MATTKQSDTYSDYNSLSTGSKLDSLDLVTSLVPLIPFITTPIPTEFPTSQRRYETKSTKNVQPTFTPPTTAIPLEANLLEITTTEGQLTDSYFDNDHNLRRHSHEEHEDYDIECDPTEPDLVHNLHSEPANTFEDKSTLETSSATTERSFVTSSMQSVTVSESMRRMSESEEISTECDSAEEEIPKYSTKIGPSNELLASVNLGIEEIGTTGRTTITDSMRRMSESHETECESNERIDQTEPDQPVTKNYSISPAVHSTRTEESTTMSPYTDSLTTVEATLPVEVLSRRMSEFECSNDKFTIENDGNFILMTPISESMRRMSDSNENLSNECDSHEDFIEVTTAVPFISDSMRRMSSEDPSTTEQNFEEQTEYVTECDTVQPETSHDINETVARKKDATLQCCPDMVCSLLYPSMPICDKQSTETDIRKLVELRDMYYLNRANVLITEIVGKTNDEYTEKRVNYERNLISLWNDTLSISPNNITKGCTNSSSSNNIKQIISSIYCVLKHTDNLLLNDSALAMVVDAAERIETDFTENSAITYLKFRQIILQSMPKEPNQSDTVSTLASYMYHNHNYENERLLLLQLLIDIQQRFEKKTEKYIVSQINIKITDASKSMQKNGLGINLHRTLN